MIKNYEMRRALTSAQLAKDTSTDVLKQLIVKNAVRLGQTLSDVELEVITSDLQTYLSGLPISFAEVSLVLREGVNCNLSTDKVYKMTSSAVQGWFDSYFKMYAKQRATLVAELKEGIEMHIVPGSEKNIKITTVEDLEILKALMHTSKESWVK